MKALQVCDRDGAILPKFYAVHIPPVSTEHLDMSVLLGQMNLMQSEMRDLKQAVQSLQVAALKPTHPSQSYAKAASVPGTPAATFSPVLLQANNKLVWASSAFTWISATLD